MTVIVPKTVSEKEGFYTLLFNASEIPLSLDKKKLAKLKTFCSQTVAYVKMIDDRKVGIVFLRCIEEFVRKNERFSIHYAELLGDGVAINQAESSSSVEVVPFRTYLINETLSELQNRIQVVFSSSFLSHLKKSSLDETFREILGQFSPEEKSSVPTQFEVIHTIYSQFLQLIRNNSLQFSSLFEWIYWADVDTRQKFTQVIVGKDLVVELAFLGMGEIVKNIAKQNPENSLRFFICLLKMEPNALKIFEGWLDFMATSKLIQMEEEALLKFLQVIPTKEELEQIISDLEQLENVFSDYGLPWMDFFPILTDYPAKKMISFLQQFRFSKGQAVDKVLFLKLFTAYAQEKLTTHHLKCIEILEKRRNTPISSNEILMRIFSYPLICSHQLIVNSVVEDLLDFIPNQESFENQAIYLFSLIRLGGTREVYLQILELIDSIHTYLGYSLTSEEVLIFYLFAPSSIDRMKMQDILKSLTDQRQKIVQEYIDELILPPRLVSEIKMNLSAIKEILTDDLKIIFAQIQRSILSDYSSQFAEIFQISGIRKTSQGVLSLEFSDSKVISDLNSVLIFDIKQVGCIPKWNLPYQLKSATSSLPARSAIGRERYLGLSVSSTKKEIVKTLTFEINFLHLPFRLQSTSPQESIPMVAKTLRIPIEIPLENLQNEPFFFDMVSSFISHFGKEDLRFDSISSEEMDLNEQCDFYLNQIPSLKNQWEIWMAGRKANATMKPIHLIPEATLQHILISLVAVLKINLRRAFYNLPLNTNHCSSKKIEREVEIAAKGNIYFSKKGDPTLVPRNIDQETEECFTVANFTRDEASIIWKDLTICHAKKMNYKLKIHNEYCTIAIPVLLSYNSQVNDITLSLEGHNSDAVELKYGTFFNPDDFYDLFRFQLLLLKSRYYQTIVDSFNQTYSSPQSSNLNTPVPTTPATGDFKKVIGKKNHHRTASSTCIDGSHSFY